jgi:hypothetical protein
MLRRGGPWYYGPALKPGGGQRACQVCQVFQVCQVIRSGHLPILRQLGLLPYASVNGLRVADLVTYLAILLATPCQTSSHKIRQVSGFK